MSRFTQDEYQQITGWLIAENTTLDDELKKWATGELVATNEILARHVARREHLAKVSQVVTGNKP